MKLILKTLIPLIALSSFAADAEIGCGGKVTALMANHNNCKDNNNKKQFAFRTESTGPNWLCAGSDSASSFVLSAKMADKRINVYLSNSNGETCQSYPGYTVPLYMIVNE